MKSTTDDLGYYTRILFILIWQCLKLPLQNILIPTEPHLSRQAGRLDASSPARKGDQLKLNQPEDAPAAPPSLGNKAQGHFVLGHLLPLLITVSVYFRQELISSSLPSPFYGFVPILQDKSSCTIPADICQPTPQTNQTKFPQPLVKSLPLLCYPSYY